jgi:phage baseplate assembly protein W
MAKKRFYSVKFPFTAEDRYKFYLDLNTTIYDSIRSDITHLLFTPTGSRLRDPKFGSNLIRLLFQPHDEITFGDIKTEINTSVSRYLPKVTITDLQVENADDMEGRTARVKMNYKVDEGQFFVEDSISIDL